MDLVHPIDPAWRVKTAELYLASAEAVGSLLAHVEDCLHLFETNGDNESVEALRGLRGLMRSRYNDLNNAGETVQAELASAPETE
jgi:hypothetical protein